MIGTAVSREWSGYEAPDRCASVVILAESGVLFEGLARQIEAHIAHSKVEIAGSADASGVDSSVGLVLLHVAGGEDVEQRIMRSRALFPEASIALVVNQSSGEDDWRPFSQSSLIEGYLPLTLKLGVFLAAVSLIISGGQYFPVTRSVPTRFAKDTLVATLTSGHSIRARVGTEADVNSDRRSAMPDLTTREQQILSLIAQGLQNKLIADQMQLSEHTVKVHVHNLMNKLRVTNRTQAAAAYHRLSPGGQGASSRPAAQ